ncbi:MAG TPA: hypothetical protein VN285_01115, partial [Candidatus Deferrimicrobium sp.]|nr:hypothetical protein [Candidatus Deferrimicrobium sp.]
RGVRPRAPRYPADGDVCRSQGFSTGPCAGMTPVNLVGRISNPCGSGDEKPDVCNYILPQFDRSPPRLYLHF